MDKFLEKISSYNLFNNLLPGAILCLVTVTLVVTIWKYMMDKLILLVQPLMNTIGLRTSIVPAIPDLVCIFMLYFGTSMNILKKLNL